MEIVIATDPERENLIAEVREGSYSWADVRYDDQKETYQLTFYPPNEAEYLVVDLTQALKGLIRAKDALVARGYPDLKII